MFSKLSRSAHLATLALALALGAPALGCGGAGGEAKSAASPLLDKPAPELTADYVTGDGPKKIADGSGKVVIVDFWGTFCEPCKQSFPRYQEMIDQLNGQLAVIAVSRDDADDKKDDDLKAFAKDAKAKFTILWDKKGDDAKKYDPAKMPTVYIIDKKGVIRHVVAGYEPGEETKIAEKVKALAAE